MHLQKRFSVVLNELFVKYPLTIILLVLRDLFVGMLLQYISPGTIIWGGTMGYSHLPLPRKKMNF